jgi:methylated-DNA-[protein]-cysteine S-methyltransferase
VIASAAALDGPVADRFALVASPVGDLLLTGDGTSLTGCWFTDPATPTARADGLERDDDAFADAARQLGEYFAGERTAFDLALAPTGTDFQLRVWAQLRTIPYGATCSYAAVARGIGATNGFRAVGLANGRNPISIIVPCHRVIGADGSLTGYGGGIERKRFLLDLEAGALPFG